MSILTVTTMLLVLLGGLTRLGWPRALGIAGATPAGAAIVVGGSIAVPTFAAVAIAAVAAFVLRELAVARRTERRSVPIPGMLALIAFLSWVVAVTLMAPVIFNGFAVTGPAVGEIHQLDSATQPATSNIAQMAYLALGVGVVAIVARERKASVQAAGLTVVIATMLSSWALLHRDFGLPFPEGVFDNSPSFRYISTAAGGLERFRGIFSEPASLAGMSLAAIAFLVALIPRVHGARRVLACGAIVLALWNISVSTATTAIVSGLVLGVIAALAFLFRFIIRRQSVDGLFLAALCVVVVALLPLLPLLADGVSATINDKVGSSSYDDRSFADAFSYSLTLRTFGLGVGVGSNRPSSLLAALLSTTGLIGTVLFIGCVGYLLWRSRASRPVRPVWWAFISFMITRFISAPDLGDPTGLTWVCLGTMAGSLLASTALLERDFRSEARPTVRSLWAGSGPR